MSKLRCSSLAKAAVLALSAAAATGLILGAPRGGRDRPVGLPRAGESVSVPSNTCPEGLGRLLTFNLASAPFPHEARKEGFSRDGEDFGFKGHYDDSSVTVFVPAGYAERGPTNLVLFFHGWMSSRSEAEKEFALLEQFEASGARALLAIPETAKDAPDSFGGKLEEPGGFDRFVLELLADLARAGIARSARPGKIVLAGHSGAYRVISRILAEGGLSARVEEVYLFDALYGGEDEFRSWIEGKGKRFACLVSAGGDTEDRARLLARALESDGVDALWSQDDPLGDWRTSGAKVLFLISSSDHHGIVSDRSGFRRLLESSAAIGRR